MTINNVIIDYHSSIHSIAQKKICKPKCEEGLGIRKPKDVNAAYFVNQGWKFYDSVRENVDKISYNELLNSHSFLEISKTSAALKAWKSILNHRKLLSKRLLRILGNGKKL